MTVAYLEVLQHVAPSQAYCNQLHKTGQVLNTSESLWICYWLSSQQGKIYFPAMFEKPDLWIPITWTKLTALISLINYTLHSFEQGKKFCSHAIGDHELQGRVQTLGAGLSILGGFLVRGFDNTEATNFY